MTALLETLGLQKAFGAVVAASDVSVAVRRGQKLGLIGNNGAGKTTFVNIVTGHLKPDAGRVLLDGKDITGLAPRQVRRNGVSRSFQIPQLFGSLTLEQNLLMALAILREEGLSSWRPARADAHMAELEELLERFRLRPYREQTIAALPGGVRKLIDVAMAVTHQPKLLLLDEPTEGLAPAIVQQIGAVLRMLKSKGFTILLVEQNFRFASVLADRFFVMEHGRIIDAFANSELAGRMDRLHEALGV